MSAPSSFKFDKGIILEGEVLPEHSDQGDKGIILEGEVLPEQSDQGDKFFILEGELLPEHSDDGDKVKGIILEGEVLPEPSDEGDGKSCEPDCMVIPPVDDNQIPSMAAQKEADLPSGNSLQMKKVKLDHEQTSAEAKLEMLPETDATDKDDDVNIRVTTSEDNEGAEYRGTVLPKTGLSECLHLVDLEDTEDASTRLICEESHEAHLLEEKLFAESVSLSDVFDLTLQQEAEACPDQTTCTWLSRNGKTFINMNAWTVSNIPVDKLYESVFDCLPDELMLKIFSYLTTREICLHVAPVCRKWRQFSRDHSLWQCIDFSFNPHLKSIDFLWIVRKAPLLHKLIIRGRTNITQAEVAILSEICHELREIDLGFCDDMNSAMVQCLSENCPMLKKVNVEGCEKLDRRSIKYLVRCKNLSHLNLSHCVLDDSSVTYLVNNLSCIQSLNLDGIAFVTDRSIKSLVNKHKAHLVELDLDGAEISDTAIELITQCKHLRHLGISFCDCLTDESLEYIKMLPGLRTLRLRKGSDFSSEALKNFFTKAHLKSLRSLNLSECTNVDDDVVLEMAMVCGRQLHVLALNWCWFITDTGLISIMDHCCNLESLDLLGIDKIRGECLQRVPEEMPRLNFLDLRQCNQIVDSLIMDVVRRKPDLHVINYYGEEFVSIKEASTFRDA